MPVNQNSILEGVVQGLDFDGTIYGLIQIAVRQRDEADKGTNRADKKYKQQVVEILLACQTALENIED